MADTSHRCEGCFVPVFLESLTVLELVALQHDLRTYPEDRPHLDQVLEEFRRRDRQVLLEILDADTPK